MQKGHIPLNIYEVCFESQPNLSTSANILPSPNPTFVRFQFHWVVVIVALKANPISSYRKINVKDPNNGRPGQEQIKALVQENLKDQNG